MTSLKIKKDFAEFWKENQNGEEELLHEYYLNREICEATFPFSYEGDDEDVGMMYFQKLLHLVSSALFDRRDVAL